MEEPLDHTPRTPDGPLKGAALEVCHADGRPWSIEDQRNYVLEKLDDTGLIWCDMAPFLFDETGHAVFVDDCDNSYPAPEDDPDLRVRLIGPFSFASEDEADCAIQEILLDLEGDEELSHIFRLAGAHLRDPMGHPWPEDGNWPQEAKTHFLEAVYGEDGWHQKVGLATDGLLYVRNRQLEAIAKLLEDPCTPETAAELYVTLSWATAADQEASMRTSIAHGESTPWCFGYDWEHAATDRWVNPEQPA